MLTTTTAEANPSDSGLDDKRELEMLDYVQGRTDKTMAVLRQSYDDLHERAYKLATVLVAGGGAAGGYALGKIGGPAASLFAWAPVAALALSWFGIASLLIWRGATSKELSPGVGPLTLLKNYDARMAFGTGAGNVLAGLRRQEMELEQARVGAYGRGCTARAESIDLAYKAAAVCTPLVPTLVASYCYFFGR